MSRCPTCGSASPCWYIFKHSRGRCEDDFHDGACKCGETRLPPRTSTGKAVQDSIDLLDGDQ